jgi:hypothetical protein
MRRKRCYFYQGINRLIALFLLTILTGCALVSYYDAVSYKNLTDLKGEMKVFFDNCSKNYVSGEQALNSLQSFNPSS